jgi:hypothetical protein
MTTYPPVPEPTEPERPKSDRPESHESEPARPAWDKVEPEPPHGPAREQGPGKSQPPWEPEPTEPQPPWEPEPTEPRGGLEEPSPNDPDPVEPNQSPSSDPERNRPEPDSPEPEPFSGNPAPDDQEPEPDRNRGGVHPEDPVPGAAASPEDAPHRPEPQPPSPSGAEYAPYPGGAAPPPPPPAPPPPGYGGESSGPLYGRQARNGLGTAALVCGIIAVVLSFIPGVNWFTWPLGVLAIVFGAIGWSRANKAQATNRNIAVTGLVLGILSFFTFCLIYVIIGASGDSMYYDAAPML